MRAIWSKFQEHFTTVCVIHTVVLACKTPEIIVLSFAVVGSFVEEKEMEVQV